MSFLTSAAAAKALARPARWPALYISPRQTRGRTVYWSIMKGDIGRALVAVCDEAICWLSLDDRGESALKDRFFAVWKDATLIEKRLPLMQQAVSANPPPLPLLLVGTPFQHQVWQMLLRIPAGRLVSYRDVALALNKPLAARAVGNAVGRNTVTWLMPCHRVGHSDGSLRGFGWGEACKRRLLKLEGFGAEAMPAFAAQPKNRASSKARAAAA